MITKRLIFPVLFLLGINLSNAQFWKTRISGNGQITTEQRTISDFDKISVVGPFDVKIITGKGKITVKADQNLMNKIETYVKSGKLVIRINPDFDLTKYTKLLVVVPVDYLSKIALTGSGHVYNESSFNWHNLKLILTGSGDMVFLSKVDHLDVALTGSGTVKLKGQAEFLDALITGSGELLSKDLKATDAKITLTGSGEAYVQCQKHLTVKIFGSGEVFYFGEPEYLKTKIFGSGEINFRML